MSDQQHPGWGRSMGVMWLYTLLRFGLFGLLWLILWAVGVGWLLAAIIAAVLSVPLSYVLLSRPRSMFARNVEERIEARRARQADLDAKLRGERDQDH